MFTDLIKLIEDNGKGIHALRKCAEEAYRRSAADVERSAAWVLMAALAEGFIEANERMAVSTVHIQQQFDLMSANAKTLERAFAESDAANQLAALNTVASSLTKPNG